MLWLFCVRWGVPEGLTPPSREPSFDSAGCKEETLILEHQLSTLKEWNYGLRPFPMMGVQWRLRPWFTIPTLPDLEQYATLVLAAISRSETLNKRDLFHRSGFPNK